MVRIKGKKKASTSKNLNENEVAQDALVETENSVSMIVDMEQSSGGAHSENKETASMDMSKNEEDEERKHEEQTVIVHTLVETENSDTMIINMEQTSGDARSENKETALMDVTKNEEDEEIKNEEQNVVVHALVETRNSDSMIVNMEQTSAGAHSENRETASMGATKNEDDEKTKYEEQNVIIQKSEKTLIDDEDIQGLNGYNLTEEDQKSEKTPEDDEDNQEGLMEEDDEDDSIEEYDEEDTSEEENEVIGTFEDDDSEPSEDEDSEEDATEEEDDNEKNAKEEEIAEGDSEKAEDCNEENMGAVLKEKTKKSEERIRKKVKENSVANDKDSEENRMKEEDNSAKKDKENAEGDGKNAEERNAEKLERSSKEKVKKSRPRNRKKKVEDGSSKKVASAAEDRPESSTKKKSKKRAESMGMIFMCSSQTKVDCYHYKILGLPASKKDLVKKIYKGMRLFLYDIDLKLMYGIYKAAGPGGYNIEPKAFKSQFPSQVRFTIFEDCLPLAEEKFKMVIKDNYFTRNKFDCQLTSSQVKKLCNLFVPARKVNPSKKLGRRGDAENPTVGRRGEAENPTPVHRERKRRQRGDDGIPMRGERKRRQRGDDGIPMRGERKMRQRGDDGIPMRQERNRRQRRDDGRHTSSREERRQHERPRKRQRDAVRPPVAPHWQPPPLPAPAPQPLIVPSYAYRTPEINVYRLDSYSSDRDPYRGGRDPYFVRRRPYIEGLDPHIEPRDSSRDARRLAPQDTYRREDSSRDARRLAPQDTYRREPISVHPDVYRRERLVEYPDSYRRDELLEYRDLPSSNLETMRRDEIGSRDHYVSYRDHLSNLETRRRDEIVSRDPYVSYQDRPSYASPLYSTERHSQRGLVPAYRLAAPITDHLSTREPLPEYRSRY